MKTANELAPLNLHDLQFCIRRMPAAVRELLKKHPRRACVAGGFIRAVIAGEKINDIDIFAQNADHAKALAFELAKEKRGFQTIEHRVLETQNAYTVFGYSIDPQIIHRWTFDDVMDVCPSFDYTIACAIIFWDDNLLRWRGYADPNFYADLAAKRLVYRSPARNEDAGGSMLRLLKFYQRGYRIPLDSPGAVMARMMQGLNFTNGGLAHDKQTGKIIDEAYSAKVLTGLLREVDPNYDPTHLGHVESLSDSEVTGAITTEQGQVQRARVLNPNADPLTE